MGFAVVSPRTGIGELRRRPSVLSALAPSKEGDNNADEVSSGPLQPKFRLGGEGAGAVVRSISGRWVLR
jgi:hypothetical protein